MYNIVNIVSNDDWLKEYRDSDDLRSFIGGCLCDGAEAIRCLPDGSGKVTPDLLKGCHLMFYPNWVDFWRGNETYLKKHFGSREVWEGYYRCKTPEEYAEMIRADMDWAEEMGAEYAVFHVSDVSNEEIFDYKWEHTNTEVIDATAELLNYVMRGRGYHFKLLLENLFTPGMTLTDPHETERMLSALDYENKGLLLDTGHLMSTNLDLENEDEALDYVLSTVRRHGELARYIRGMHLHQSVTGACVREMFAQNIVPERDFYASFAQSYAWILKIDRHLPFTSPRVRELIDLVQPDYLVHELAAPDRDAKTKAVLRQMKALGRA